ncbi:MAG TPA: fibronectin type III domain-containing protein, partial [Nakamurella sp.]|nr:fibronectin type III domain-containing protein [Nakamurella sp.]
PLLSGLIDLLSDTLSGVVSLTSNYQTTTPDGAFMVSALHVSLLNNAAAHADLASVTVGPNVPLSVPGAPIDLTATAGDAQVDLSWTAPTDDGGSPILGYNVFVGTEPGGESATPVNGGTLVPGTTYTVTGLTNGTTYYFVVEAVNDVGSSDPSNEASATPEAEETVPGAPINLTAAAGDGYVNLSWTAPDDGGSPILGYDVYLGTESGGEAATPVNGDTLVPGLGYQVTGLTNGTTYYFIVKAVNALGSSDPSNEASATPSGAECPAPFLDVPSTNPFCADITWMKDNGITNGYPDGTYRPVAPTTRGMMAGFVYRQLNPGGPAPACTSKPYPDTATDNPFCGAITWLKEHGIIQGYDDGTFRPDAPISRQAIAAYMFRMNNQGQPDPSCTTAPFADVPITNPFCGDIEWMKDTGVSYGGTGGNYFPLAQTTRQAMAGLIHRMVSVL